MRRLRRRIRARLLLVILSIAVAICAYIFGLSYFQSRGSSWVQANELIVPRTIDVVIFIWLFWIGSAVGSFLNVVAWRMPRGESVNGRSYCPRCKTQLKARDNFPVFGWLALGGRCRTCRLPISVRYPIVEAAVGFSLTLVGIFELYRLSLPGQLVHWHGGPFWTPRVDRVILITLVYHLVALTFAWAIGLIRMDGKRLPSRLVVLAMAAATLPMLAYPNLMVVPWQTEYPPGWSAAGLHLDALLRIVTSLAAAVVLGRYLSRTLCPGADPKLDPLGRRTGRLIDLIAIIALPAIVVGWHVIAVVIVVASFLSLLLRPLLPPQVDALGRLAIAMPVALTLQIMAWRTLQKVSFWPGVGSSPWVILAAVGLLFLVPLWLRDETT